MLDPNNPKHAHVDQRLRGEPIIWLGSVRPDGRPHMVPVWFLWDGELIYTFSQERAQKIRNLQANPNVTLALEAANHGADIAIVEGTVEICEAAEGESIYPAYVAKYQQAMAAMGWTPENLTAQFSKLIRVKPSRLIAW